MRSLLASLLLVSCLSGCDAVAYRNYMILRRFTRAGMVQRDVQLPSGRMRIYDGGSGPPVILLHGFGFGALENWRKQVPAFARGRRMIAVDFYWFGNSKPKREVLDARSQAQSIVELLDKLGLPRADFVGMSYGGLVALHVALEHPSRVGRLVLVDTAGITPNDQEREVISKAFGGTHKLEDVLVPPSVDALDHLLGEVFLRKRWIPRWALRQIFAEFHRNEREKTELCKNVAGDLLTKEELARVRAPTLLVWGQHDHLLPATMGKRLAGALGDAELVLFDQSGHSPMLEEPLRFEHTVLGFLDASMKSKEPAIVGGRAASP
jgi:pimeloyl-ACP methyl ester carboxylesterase